MDNAATVIPQSRVIPEAINADRAGAERSNASLALYLDAFVLR